MHTVDQLASLADQTWLRLATNRDRISNARLLLASTANRLQTNSRSSVAIDDRARDLLAAAYEIDVSRVAIETRAIQEWDAPFDDLLRRICRSHAWDAATGVVYLGAVRSALNSGSVECPWLEDGDDGSSLGAP